MDPQLPELLTPFGNFLSQASRVRYLNQQTTPEAIPDAYLQNERVWGNLKSAVQQKPRVLILGAGSEPDFASIEEKTRDWLRIGVQWTNFNPEINIDVIGGNHIAPLEASARALGAKNRLIIHGVSSIVPAVLARSCTVRWLDPYHHVNWPGGAPTVELAQAVIAQETKGPVPRFLAVQNSLFMLSMVALHLGAKQVAFAGVDPDRPYYFFSGKPEILIELLKHLVVTDPYLGEWDGVNDRIPMLHRPTAHRTLSMLPPLLSQISAVSDDQRSVTMQRGIEFFKAIANSCSVDVGYFGSSSFMARNGVDKFD